MNVVQTHQVQVDGTAADAAGPTALRIGLGGELRRRRELAGITREVAGDALRAAAVWAGFTLVMTLLLEGPPPTAAAGIRALGARASAALALARRANAPGWWHRYSDLLPGWFETYLGLEQASSMIRTYELQFVPGLLQTQEYARAVTMLGHENRDDVDRRVELRMRRQKVLTAPGAPTLWAVIDEAALRRSLNGPALLRNQLDHLLAMNELPNVSVQIAPLSFGGHAAAGGPFSILRFAEPDLPDIVYLEQLTSALYLDKRSDVEHYTLVMDRLCAHIEPPGTATIIDEIRGGV